MSCKGKDPRSVGYNLGIQEVVLEKMETKEEAAEKSAETWPSATNHESAGKGAAAAGGTEYRGRPLSFYTDKLNNGKAWERIRAARALGSFGADATSAVPELARVLRDNDENLRQASVWSIGQIGAASGTAGVDALRKALNDTNGKVRCLAAIGLEGMGTKATAVIPDLIHASTIPRISSAPVRHRLSGRWGQQPGRQSVRSRPS